MIIFFSIAIGVYLLFELLLLVAWHGTTKQRYKRVVETEVFISIVVPFRNEEDNIATIISQLARQNYPTSKYEVILVNDHSSDFSQHFSEMAITGKPNFKMFSLSGKEGKKQAIALGVRLSRGSIIATTDADCEVPVNWLKYINSTFDDEIKFVFGGVQIRGDGSFFSNLQALEFCSLIGSGAATLKMGFPTMCNGANLAFLKSAFDEVGGYEGNWNIPSGDDEFLMRKINKRFPGSISFINKPGAVVSTKHQTDISSFLHQRLRWAGKWKYNQSFVSKILALFIFIIQFLFLVLLGFLLAGAIDFKIGLVLILAKLLIDFLFLYLISGFLRLRWYWIPFFCLELVYPLYVIFIGLRSQDGYYFWKGRKLSHQF